MLLPHLHRLWTKFACPSHFPPSSTPSKIRAEKPKQIRHHVGSCSCPGSGLRDSEDLPGIDEIGVSDKIPVGFIDFPPGHGGSNGAAPLIQGSSPNATVTAAGPTRVETGAE